MAFLDCRVQPWFAIKLSKIPLSFLINVHSFWIKTIWCHWIILQHGDVSNISGWNSFPGCEISHRGQQQAQKNWHLVFTQVQGMTLFKLEALMMSNNMPCPIPKKKVISNQSHVSKARSEVYLIEIWDDWHDLANRNVTLTLVGTCTELLEKLGRGYQWKLALYVYGFAHPEDGFISFQQITHCFVCRIGWAAVFAMEVSFS